NRTCNAYEYVQGITIILKNGDIAYYDKLSSSSERSNWINFDENTAEGLENKDNTLYLSDENSADIGNEKYYMFSIAHKIIDYNDINNEIGTVIMSIDTSILQDACTNTSSEDNNKNNLGTNIICNDEGEIIYSDDDSDIGESSYVHDKKIKGNIKITELDVPACRWKIKSYYDQSQYDSVIVQNIIMTFTMISIIVVVLIILVFYVSDKLVSSIRVIVDAMKSVEKGNLDVTISHDEKMPVEIEIIAVGFSLMLKNIKNLMNNIKEAGIKQKNAEIKALEAQINPHFLYNTLDTINWKAIENKEFEISEMINSLGKILRYSVLNSNGVVTIKEEMDWLKPYIYLQQSRFKNKFELFTNIDEELIQCHTHKLLLQPFIENAISHGLKQRKSGGILIITAEDLNDYIEFSIDNNGPKIDEDIVSMVNNNSFTEEYSKSHIGIANVMCRLKMYYGDKAYVHIESSDNDFSRVKIRIPKFYSEQ
ncbi:MAG: histidine kinase, partial [Clostridium sp.]|nr:histidine kinase [Clostridium sp.]